MYAKILISHFQVLMQFHLVMDIDYPPQFDLLLSYLAFIKGDILKYLNVKCMVVSLNIYSEFVLAMLTMVRICGVRKSIGGRRHYGHSDKESRKGGSLPDGNNAALISRGQNYAPDLLVSV